MTKWLAAGLVGAALLAALLVRVPSWAPPSPDPGRQACLAAQQAVKARLKTVATALFPDCADTSIRRTGAGRWRVESRFDADFLFGENARTGYAASVEQHPGGFRVTDLKIWP